MMLQESPVEGEEGELQEAGEGENTSTAEGSQPKGEAQPKVSGATKRTIVKSLNLPERSSARVEGQQVSDIQFEGKPRIWKKKWERKIVKKPDWRKNRKK